MPYPGQLFHYIDGSSPNYAQFEDTINSMRASATSGRRCKFLKKMLLSTLGYVSLLLPQSLFDLITLCYAGFITDANHFAAIGLTLVFSNMLIRRVVVCCTTSLQALIKQALNYQQYYRISTHYQKTGVLLFIWTIMATLLLVGFGFMLNLLKFPPEFGIAFRLFNYVLIPSYFANLIFSLVKSLYLSYGISRIPIYFMWTRVILSICLNVVFYKILGPDLISVGIARGVTEVVIAASLYYYTKIKNKFVQALGYSWTSRAFSYLPNFFKLLLKRGSSIHLNRISLDLLMLIIIFFCQTEIIAAQACLCAYVTFLQVIPLSLCLATYKYFNVAVEEGNEQRAKNHALVGCLSCLAVCLPITGLNFIFLYKIPKIFWANPYFQTILSNLIVIYSIAIWFDSCFHIMSIVFKRLMGRRFGLKSAFITLIIGLPLSAILGLLVQMDITFIWIGRVSSLLLVNLVLARKLAVLDWWQQVRRLYFEQKEQFDDTPLDL